MKVRIRVPESHSIIVRTDRSDEALVTMSCYHVAQDIRMELPLSLLGVFLRIIGVDKVAT